MDKMKLWDMIVAYGKEIHLAGMWQDSDYQERYQQIVAADALLEEIKEILHADE